jgi:hypothetical protein
MFNVGILEMWEEAVVGRDHTSAEPWPGAIPNVG